MVRQLRRNDVIQMAVRRQNLVIVTPCRATSALIFSASPPGSTNAACCVFRTKSGCNSG